MHTFEKDSSELLKLVEASRILGVHYKTVWRWVTTGKIPSTRIGGLYFIRRKDLEGLLANVIPFPEEGITAAETAAPIAALLKCGYCYRILSSENQVGEPCLEPGCCEVICSQCQENGYAYCARHLPTRGQLIEGARARYERGEVPVLVESGQAGLREMNFINRIQAHLAGIVSLIHPVSGEPLTISDWSAITEQRDDRAEVMRLLNKAVLDSATLAQTPLNTRLEACPPLPRNSKAMPLVVEIRVISRLPEMLRHGFDTRPLTCDDLIPWLSKLTSEAQKENVFRLELLASVTGWDASARQVIQGQEDRPGTAFAHRMALFYLFDLEKGDLVYYPQDDRARRYAELFVPLLPSEELAETVQAVEKAMTHYDTLTLKFAVQVLPYPEKQLKLAFSRLAESGPYALTEVPNLGLTIIRR